MYPLVITLAILPGLVVCYLIFRLDKYEKEPRLPLILCFVLGMLLTFPVMYLENLAGESNWNNPRHFWLTLTFAFVAVALTEEVFKALALWIYPYRIRSFNEPMDGIVYTVMIGMGFATFENLLYADRFGLETILVRAFTAVPAHGLFAIILGYYVGLAKFDPARTWQWWGTGLLWTVALHGVYDFFILQELYDWLILFAILTLIAGAILARKLILDHQEHSPFHPQDPPPS